MTGYPYWKVHVTEEAVSDAIVDVLAIALDDLRKKAGEERGSLDGLHTVLMPPDGHAEGSEERVMRRLWTVALTENPTDFARRLSGAVRGYSL